MSVKAYYDLCKPGIVYGNALTAAASFFLAASGTVNWELFLATIIGLSCIIASACVFNNYFDREIDRRMERTKSRAFAAGTINPTYALIFGVVLLIAGIKILYIYSNVLALGVALAGFVIYVALYTPLKHKSAHALWVGALAGATPPAVGYVSVTNTFDLTALWLFLFLFLWQIPHFLAIAVYRYDEYAAAGVPLLIKKSPSLKAKHWARIVFFSSLVVLLLWCVVISLPSLPGL